MKVPFDSIVNGHSLAALKFFDAFRIFGGNNAYPFPHANKNLALLL